MATLPFKLTAAEFESRYGQSEGAFEYWFGEAISRGMPTWIHGLLQRIVMELLTEAGFIAASEVEVRVIEEAHPKPDVIATKGKPELPYPTKGVDVVVEILSAEDKMPYLRSKCRAYQAWGFGRIYLVDPSDRSVLEWVDGSLMLRDEIVSIPAARIWSALDLQIQ